MRRLHLTQHSKLMLQSFFVAIVLISLIICLLNNPGVARAAQPRQQLTVTPKPGQLDPLKAKLTPQPSQAPKVGTVATAQSPIKPVELRGLPSTPLVCTTDFIDKWSTSSSEFETVNSCTLVVPTGGKAYINAGASLGLTIGGQAYESQFKLAVDGVYLTQMDRWVDVYPDSSDGSDVSLAMSTIESVGPGTHTFTLVGKLLKGPGPILLYRPILSVLFFPVSAKNLLCTTSTIDSWRTTSITFQPIRSCILDLPTRGTVYIDANATASLTGAGESYEGSFRIGVDSSYLPQTERRVNIYTDSRDGSDVTLATTTTQTLEAGKHTFSFAAKLYSGVGPLQVYRPSLSVIFSPEGSSTPIDSSPVLDNWFSSSYEFTPVTAVTLNLSCPATVLVQANASVGLATFEPQPYEANFQIKIDGTGFSESDRWLNIYTDDGDGTDKSLATTLIQSLQPGSHTFELDARLYGGAGPIQLYDPVVAVVVIYNCTATYLPVIMR
jgi:hypothetical protein